MFASMTDSFRRGSPYRFHSVTDGLNGRNWESYIRENSTTQGGLENTVDRGQIALALTEFTLRGWFTIDTLRPTKAHDLCMKTTQHSNLSIVTRDW